MYTVVFQGTVGPMREELLKLVNKFLRNDGTPQMIQILNTSTGLSFTTDFHPLMTFIRQKMNLKTAADGRVMKVDGHTTSHWKDV